MINPDVCIITSIDHSHLAGLGTIQNVANEKIKFGYRQSKSCIGVFPGGIAPISMPFPKRRETDPLWW